MTIMRFLVRLQNRTEASPSQRTQLSRAAYDRVRPFEGNVGNLRVSSQAVELDLLIDSENALENCLKALEDLLGRRLSIRKLDVKSPPMRKTEAVTLGLDLFNDQRYWESHEALESAWLNASGGEKEVLQGVILVAAAFVHLQKDEADVALSMIGRASKKLAHRNGEYCGIDLEDLRQKVDNILANQRPEYFTILSK